MVIGPGLGPVTSNWAQVCAGPGSAGSVLVPTGEPSALNTVNEIGPAEAAPAHSSSSTCKGLATSSRNAWKREPGAPLATASKQRASRGTASLCRSPTQMDGHATASRNGISAAKAT